MSGAAAERQLGGADLVAGAQVAERRVVLDAAAFRGFAVLTGDAHPIHYDAVYAKAHGLRAPIAHGLLIVAMTALGATTLSARLADSMIAMLGVEVRFVAPVFLGDAVVVRFRVEGVTPKSANRCLAAFAIDVRSPEGELHAEATQRYLLKHRLEGQVA